MERSIKDLCRSFGAVLPAALKLEREEILILFRAMLVVTDKLRLLLNKAAQADNDEMEESLILGILHRERMGGSLARPRPNNSSLGKLGDIILSRTQQQDFLITTQQFPHSSCNFPQNDKDDETNHQNEDNNHPRQLSAYDVLVQKQIIKMEQFLAQLHAELGKVPIADLENIISKAHWIVNESGFQFTKISRAVRGQTGRTLSRGERAENKSEEGTMTRVDFVLDQEGGLAIVQELGRIAFELLRIVGKQVLITEFPQSNYLNMEDTGRIFFGDRKYEADSVDVVDEEFQDVMEKIKEKGWV